jgi:hypothetical protein
MANRYEKALVLLLRLDAVLLLTALVPSMMPFAWMQAIHRALGMGELAEGPLIGYLTRSLSIMYAMHGAMMLFVSLDVRRYLPIVKFIVLLGVLFGLWMIGLDLAVGMPLFWTVGEGPFIFLLCSVMLWLAGRVQGSSL